MKTHLIRLAVGSLMLVFVATVLYLPMWLLYSYTWPVVLIALGSLLILGIYKIGSLTIEKFYDDKEVWGQTVEDFEAIRGWFKKLLNRIKR